MVGQERSETCAELERFSMLLMRIANEAEDADARALARACRDAVEDTFVILDIIAGPARQAFTGRR